MVGWPLGPYSVSQRDRLVEYRMTKPEILAPAGNMFKLQTAVRYGADAVYLAGRRFGLRQAADNFTIEQIHQAVAFAHENGTRVYVVLNGFLFDEELEDLPPFLAELESAGVDAVIVSDLGVLTTVRRHSNLRIHLSTQASALNSHAARFWRDMGVTRLVLGREVSIAEAAIIKREARVEVELFGHGAMCMAFSGNCTISNYTAGRDSNRGGCIQSCRFKYRLSDERGGAGPQDHFLSSKDLQGIAQVPSFVEAGIDSLKIEGRMKSPLYVATTVRAYARARDAAWQRQADFGVEDLFRELNTMSHRDYTSGNLLDKAGSDSVYLHDERHEPNSHDVIGHILEATENHLAIHLRNPLETGDRLEMLVPGQDIRVLATDTLKDLTGQRVQRVSSNRVVLLPADSIARAGFLLRKPKSKIDAIKDDISHDTDDAALIQHHRAHAG